MATRRLCGRTTTLQPAQFIWVLVNGYLYGVNGIAGPTPALTLACVNLLDGASKWTYPDLGGGAIMVADGKIIALGDKGELFTAIASPDGFTPLSRVQVLGGRCWTVPVLANARIYCRKRQRRPHLPST